MHKGFKAVVKLCTYLFLMGCILGAATQPLSAQVTIPQGSTVNSAIFSVYEIGVSNQTVYLRRVTADWGELSVTINSLGSNWDPAVVGSFVTDSVGWKTVDLTGLVQAWVNGTYPNYGFLMMMDPTSPAVQYRSSEYIAYGGIIEQRPKLEIWYTTPAGVSQYVMIQRPGAAQDGVADAAIRDFINHGAEPALTTGYYNGIEKWSIIRFNFTVIPSSPGTGTPGYWMNHPEAWPEPGVTIGGNYYLVADAIALMKAPGATDKTYTMFAALVAAKLNVLIGNNASCIASTITAADSWMMTYPVGSGVAAGGGRSPWRVGEPLYFLLDAYNNGLLCAPHRD